MLRRMVETSTPEPIPFERAELGPPGVLQQVTPLIRRMVAGNKSPFTFTGTCTYVVGQGDVAIIDPGPDLPAHLDALLAALGSERVAHIVVTHTHRDHSPGARYLKAATGAPVLGCGLHESARALAPGEANMLEASNDTDYAPDTILRDGEILRGRGYTLEAVATPGHTMNHLAFAFAEEEALFSGDHVMAWSTSIVAPPDGSMAHYMASLDRLRTRDERIYWPGHGGPVRNPKPFVRALVVHRRHREAAIFSQVDGAGVTIPAIVAKIYDGLAPGLRGAAALSVFAHLEDLIAQGRVVTDGEPRLDSLYRRA
jgi:glyoxylase-like metal-dependent hydrolase (beta-lactamase superfamily II)